MVESLLLATILIKPDYTLPRIQPEKPKIEVYDDLCPTVDIVVKEIVKQATEANFDPEVALKIAKCESGFRADVKNNAPGSTASGVFQFTNPTWEWIKAEGHQFNYKENIKQFLKYYPIYPGWWECKK